ncbi:hypothetical protein CDCA_CDCA06G1956 [Cyanidium caldarium]|uniref:Core domain-containing protein n=1 Tax=Cyanidium caldarium TaxID=2771 RepID=A0AAV9IV48_CYACA|nr:hypothetical protein CDCA_CDCA06G1956 [Cyanidium caldarium]
MALRGLLRSVWTRGCGVRRARTAAQRRAEGASLRGRLDGLGWRSLGARNQSLDAGRRWLHALPEANAAPPQRLHISDKCVQRLKQLGDASRSRQPPALRVIVDSGGCSGFQYRFALEHDEPHEDDKVFERDGVRLFVDAISLPFLDGATVDYEEEMIRAAFKVESNPNSEAGCSCGSSFAPKM